MHTRFRSLSVVGSGQVLALLVAATSFTILVAGWGLGIDTLVRLSGHSAVVPSTALCLGLLALGLAMMRPAAPARTVATGAILLASLLAAGNIAVAAMGVATGLDALVGISLAEGDRMSAGTAIGLLLAATSVMMSTAESGRWVEAGFLVALGGLSTGVAVIFGHSFDPESPYALPIFASTSELTAGLLVLLFLAVLLVDMPRQRWIA